MAWTEDVKAEFFRTEDFASDWTVNGVTVRAIFDDAFVEHLDIDGTSPQILLADSDVTASGVQVEDAASGPEGSYTVRGIQRSGDGVTVLILEEA